MGFGEAVFRRRRKHQGNDKSLLLNSFWEGRFWSAPAERERRRRFGADGRFNGCGRFACVPKRCRSRRRGIATAVQNLADVAASRQSAANGDGNFRWRLSPESRYAETDGARGARTRPGEDGNKIRHCWCSTRFQQCCGNSQQHRKHHPTL